MSEFAELRGMHTCFPDCVIPLFREKLKNCGIFENCYKLTDHGAKNDALRAMRVLGHWVNDVSRGDDYEFKLKNEAGTKLANQTVRNAKGTVTFDEIKYTEADAGRIYKYEVLEAASDGNGYTVDRWYILLK